MKTHITFVLDSSGSMEKIAADTKGGYNSLLREQREEEEGTATVTLYDFNSIVEQVYEARPIADAPEVTDETYTPGGKTALHDALTTAIKQTGKRISTLPEADKPDHVMVVTLTDGKENASETPQETVRELVELKQEEADWEFLFIGANQDAALTAEQMGMDKDRSLDMDHSGEGARQAYQSTSERIREARMEGQSGGYTAADRRKQEEADK
jgi:Mg-chelatase subunit ChlD